MKISSILTGLAWLLYTASWFIQWAGYYLWFASFFVPGVACFLNQRASRAARPPWFER